MTQFCAAYGCTNRSSKPECKAKGISFHQFPLKDPPRLRLWLLRIRRAGFTPSKYSTLCSSHFTESSFVYQPFTNKRMLAQNAVPSIFVYSSSKSRTKRLCCKFGSSAQNSSKKSSERHSAIASDRHNSHEKTNYQTDRRPIVVKLVKL